MAQDDKSIQWSACCGPLRGNVQDNGGPLDPGTASTYIKSYLKGVNDNGDHNYGYLFGLKNVTDFLAAITAYNTTSPPPEVQIEGIRVYMGRKNLLDKPTTTTTTTTTNAAGITATITTTISETCMEKIMDTLFIIPVLANGEDLPIVDHAPFEGTTIILGDPRPCPTLCSQLSALL